MILGRHEETCWSGKLSEDVTRIAMGILDGSATYAVQVRSNVGIFVLAVLYHAFARSNTPIPHNTYQRLYVPGTRRKLFRKHVRKINSHIEPVDRHSATMWHMDMEKEAVGPLALAKAYGIVNKIFQMGSRHQPAVTAAAAMYLGSVAVGGKWSIEAAAKRFRLSSGSLGICVKQLHKEADGYGIDLI